MNDLQVNGDNHAAEPTSASVIAPAEFSSDPNSAAQDAKTQDCEPSVQLSYDAVPEGNKVGTQNACRTDTTSGSNKCDRLKAGQSHTNANRVAMSSFKSPLNSSDEATVAVRGVGQLKSAPTREVIDAIMAGECREWVAKVVGDTYGLKVLEEENFVDSLRDGVVLSVLLQKLRNPPVPDEALKIPKRKVGFYARENVFTFLKEAAGLYDLLEAQLFTDSDLCDAKNDRAVVTCLFSIARIAYTRDKVKLAPSMIICEEEIDAKLKNLTQEQIDNIVVDVDEELPEEDAPQEMQKCTGAEYVDGEQARMPVPCKSDGDAPHLKKVVSTPLRRRSNPECATMKELSKRENDETSTAFVKEDPTESNSKPNEGGNSSVVAPPSFQDSAVSTPKRVLPSRMVKSAPLVEAPMYNSRKWDKVDMQMGLVINAHFNMHPFSQVRFRRLSAGVGEYVVYHRTAGCKRVLYACILQGQLMVRLLDKSGKAPSWMELKNWLEQYDLETEKC